MTAWSWFKNDRTFEEMLRRQFEKIDPADSNELPYGLGVVVESTPFGKKLSHGGTRYGFSCNFAIYDELDLGYVFLINNEQAYHLDKAIDAYLARGRPQDQ